MNEFDQPTNSVIKISSRIQPDLVNDQLEQLYVDLELEGLSARLSLESSGSSDDEESPLRIHKKKVQYSKLVLIYEENCPLPSE